MMENMNTSLVNGAAALCFGGAILHSLFKPRKIELIFSLWAIGLVTFLILPWGLGNTCVWIQQRDWSEAIFVLVIMVIASTRPILGLATAVLRRIAQGIQKLFRIPFTLSLYGSLLCLGPLLGSLITEPAAITVCALLLKNLIFKSGAPSEKLLYRTLAVLFVNISIGGTLTAFAAPPILMVAPLWHWNSAFLFQHFGWKAILAVWLNGGIAMWWARTELWAIPNSIHDNDRQRPLNLRQCGLLLLFMIAAILNLNHGFTLLLILSILFLVYRTSPFARESLKFKESFGVAWFLAALVALTTSLTSVADNAALTLLAASVSQISAASQHAIVAGAVVGGGLTLIANAPNPAGAAILNANFRNGVQARLLFLHALIPTFIAGVCLWFL
jgi:hypothetical protein